MNGHFLCLVFWRDWVGNTLAWRGLLFLLFACAYIITVRRLPRGHTLALRLAQGLEAWIHGTKEFAVNVWSGTNGVARVRCLRSVRLPPPTSSLRKEVIQPQVLLRLPCYDFTPIMNHTLGRCLSCELACELLVQSTFVM